MLIELQRLERDGASDPVRLEAYAVDPDAIRQARPHREAGYDGPAVRLTLDNDEEVIVAGTVHKIAELTQAWDVPEFFDTE